MIFYRKLKDGVPCEEHEEEPRSGHRHWQNGVLPFRAPSAVTLVVEVDGPERHAPEDHEVAQEEDRFRRGVQLRD